jgi:hypothetical protein
MRGGQLTYSQYCGTHNVDATTYREADATVV